MKSFKFQILTTTVVLLALIQALTAQNFGSNRGPAAAFGNRVDTSNASEGGDNTSEYFGANDVDTTGDSSENEANSTDRDVGDGVDVGTNVFRNVAGAAANVVGGLASEGANVVDGLASAGANVVGGLASAGANVVGGLASAGANAFGGFFNAINSFGQNNGNNDNTSNDAVTTTDTLRDLNINQETYSGPQNDASEHEVQKTTITKKAYSVPDNTAESDEQEYVYVDMSDSAGQTGTKTSKSFYSQQSSNNSNQNVSVNEDSSSFSSGRQFRKSVQQSSHKIRNPGPSQLGNSPSENDIVEQNYQNFDVNDSAGQTGSITSKSINSQQSSNNSNQKVSINEDSSSFSSGRQTTGSVQQSSHKIRNPSPSQVGYNPSENVIVEQNHQNVNVRDTAAQTGRQTSESFNSENSNDNSRQKVSINEDGSSFSSGRQTTGSMQQSSNYSRRLPIPYELRRHHHNSTESGNLSENVNDGVQTYNL